MYKLLAINMDGCGRFECEAETVKELREKFLAQGFHDPHKYMFRIFDKDGNTLVPKSNNNN